MFIATPVAKEDFANEPNHNISSHLIEYLRVIFQIYKEKEHGGVEEILVKHSGREGNSFISQ